MISLAASHGASKIVLSTVCKYRELSTHEEVHNHDATVAAYLDLLRVLHT